MTCLPTCPKHFGVCCHHWNKKCVYVYRKKKINKINWSVKTLGIFSLRFCQLKKKLQLNNKSPFLNIIAFYKMSQVFFIVSCNKHRPSDQWQWQSSIWTLHLIVNSCVLLGCCTVTKDVQQYPTILISQNNISASQWMLKSSVRPWLIAVKALCLHGVKSDMRTPKPASIALKVNMYTVNWHFGFARLASVVSTLGYWPVEASYHTWSRSRCFCSGWPWAAHLLKENHISRCSLQRKKD